MLSLNVTKLLTSCKVLSDQSILLSSSCPCHNKIIESDNLDILIDGPEPILRCTSCGISYCVTSFMIRQLKMTPNEAIQNLFSAGYSHKESNELVDRAIKYLRFLGAFDAARITYRDRNGAADKRVKNFGDWGSMSGGTINNFFFKRSTSKLNANMMYHFLLLRDENGIPSKGKIFTTQGSLIGEVKIPIPSGQVSILSERWTDYVSWTGKLIICQNQLLASSVSKAMVAPDGSFNVPVGIIYDSNGEAVYFSRLKPQIMAIAGECESTYPISVMHGRNSPVTVYRFGGDNLNGFGITQTLDQELSRLTPRSITQDIVMLMKQFNQYSIKDFCNLIKSVSNSSDYFKNELIESYCLTSGNDKKYVVENISNVGSSLGHFKILKKVFKIHNGRYCEWMDDLSFSPVSNFWLALNYITFSDDKDIEYNVSLYIDDKFQTFFVSSKDLHHSNRLMDKLISMAAVNGMNHPIWTSVKYVFDAMPKIICGLGNNKLPSFRKKTFGFGGGYFASTSWKCDHLGVSIQENEVGETPFDLNEPQDLDSIRPDSQSVKDCVRDLCSSEYGAAVFCGALNIVRSMRLNNCAHLVAPRNICDGIAKVIGVPEIERLVKTKMIQYVGKSLSSRVLSSYSATLTCINPEVSYPNNFIKFYKEVDTHHLNNVTPLLMFLCNLVYIKQDRQVNAQIEQILGSVDPITNFRRMNLYYVNKKNNLNEFCECLINNEAFKKFVNFKEDKTIIGVSVFRALKDSGYKFNKQDIVQSLRGIYPTMEYPVQLSITRNTCIALSNPNIFTEKNRQKCTKRMISIH